MVKLAIERLRVGFSRVMTLGMSFTRASDTKQYNLVLAVMLSGWEGKYWPAGKYHAPTGRFITVICVADCLDACTSSGPNTTSPLKHKMSTKRYSMSPLTLSIFSSHLCSATRSLAGIGHLCVQLAQSCYLVVGNQRRPLHVKSVHHSTQNQS